MLRTAVTNLAVTRLSARVSCVSYTSVSAPTVAARFFGGSHSRVLGARRWYTSSAPSVLDRLGAAAAPTATSIYGSCSSSNLVAARRFQATQAKQESSSTEKPAAEEGAPKAEGEEGAEKKPEEPQLNMFSKLRADLTTFPDIYNSANMLNMAIFTIFCLCSTGTEGEGHWWVNQWGVDGHLQPWSWLLHSLLCNNFLTMTFAMILFHSLAHATMAQIGSRALILYLAITCTASGALMWASNSALGEYLPKEKQFGPWDAIAALFVMQYFAVGTTPWGLLLSYNGWIKYANIVGGVCIVYYDPQPLLWGTLIGLALTRAGPFKPVIAAAV